MAVVMTPIEGSTNLQAVGYDTLQRELHIEFAGGNLYIFSEVPADVHSSLMGAKSKGSFFHASIKGKYPHRKPEKEKPKTE